MVSSLDEAMPFFIKWKKERTPLDFIFSGNGVNFKFSGFLLKATREEGLVGINDESLGTVLRASLERARGFNFVDSREASEEDRPLIEAEIECAWGIRFANGVELALYERRSGNSG